MKINFDWADALWILLLLASVTGWALSRYSPISVRWMVVFLMGLAFLKAWIIGMYFMHVQHAPPAWKLGFQVWMAVVCLGIVGLTLLF